MVLSGVEIVTRHLVRDMQHAMLQQQPCGVDLTLRRVLEWQSASTVDFDNSARQAAQTGNLPFDSSNLSITLQPGAYLIEFGESVHIPRNCMATIFPRSSLWRSGVRIDAGVVDAGYQGALGALMDVRNPHGIVLHKNARIAQIVFEEMNETVKGYSGIYQFSSETIGRDGRGSA